MRRSRVSFLVVAIAASSLGGVALAADSPRAPRKAPPIAQAFSSNLNAALNATGSKRPSGRPAQTQARSARIKASRTAHKGRVSAETARDQVGKLSPALTMAHGIVPKASEIDEIVAANALRVQTKEGKPAGVMLSNLPLAINESKAGSEPDWKIADLSWERTTDRYRVARPVVPISVPKVAGDSVEVGGMGLHLAPPNAESVGIVDGEAVTYPNVAPDTDLLVRSLPIGVGVAWNLRSPDVDRTLTVPLDLPKGQKLKKDESGAIEILSADGEQVGAVSVATARDAGEQTVPVETAIDGTTVTYTVQTGADTEFPVNVDPDYYYDFNWRTGQPGFSGWFKQSTPRGEAAQPFSFSQAVENQPQGTHGGLGIFTPATFDHQNGDAGAWGRFAPGDPNFGTQQYAQTNRKLSPEHSSWYRFDAGSLTFAYVPYASYNYSNYLRPRIGFLDAYGNADTSSKWQEQTGTNSYGPENNGFINDLGNGTNGASGRVYLTNPDNPNPSALAGKADNTLGIGLVAETNTTGHADRPSGALAMGWYRAYAIDTTPPTVDSATVPAGWVESFRTTHVTATDRGTGVSKLLLRDNFNSTLDSKTLSCTPNDVKLCDFTVDTDFPFLDLPEGVREGKITAVDAGGLMGDRAVVLRLDKTPPNVQQLDAGVTVRPGSTDSSAKKTIKLRATDAASGVKAVAISIDGGAAEPVTQPTCTSAPQCPTSFDVEIPESRVKQLSTGNHRVTVTATDLTTTNAESAPRHTVTKAFDVTVYQGPGATPPAGTTVGRTTEGGLGFEDWMTYDTTPTGAGSNLRANLATGGTIWSVTPVSNPGVGLDTVFRLTYNSYEPAGLLPELLGSNGVFGYGFAGRGFSAQLGSITRVNEPLWFQTDLGVPLTGAQTSSDAVKSVILTDGDGTRQTFTRNTQPGVRFDPPAGVELELRRYTSGTSQDDQEHRWAATRPDGTTFFFGEDGLPTWTQDRNNNKLRLEYETLSGSAILPAGCGYALSCNKRLIKVTDAAAISQTDLSNVPSDANQRAWTIGYDGARISTILDRKRIGTARRRTKLIYDGENRLTSITQADNAPNDNQKRVFELSYDTTTSPDSTSLIPTPADSKSAYLSAIKDPNGNTTNVAYGNRKPATGILSPILDPLLNATGLFQGRRPVKSIRDRASTGENDRKTTYAFDDPVVESAGASKPADRTSRLTRVKNPRRIVNQVKTDGLGRMIELKRAIDDTTDNDDLPAANPRTTTQGWTDDNYVSWSTVAAETSDQQVSTDYDWGSLGELKSEYQHAGAHGSDPGDGKKRTQTWTYRRHAGILQGENPPNCTTAPERCFVYDVQSQTDRRNQTTTYTYGSDNTGRLTGILSPNGGREQFNYNSRGLITLHGTTWWEKRTTAPIFSTDKPAFNSSDPDYVTETWDLFDGNGEPVRHFDERGFQTYRQLDEAGNTTFMTDPRSGQPAFDLSAPESSLGSAADPVTSANQGSPATVRNQARTQGGKYISRWTYDALDRMVAQAIPKDSTKAAGTADRYQLTVTKYDRNDNPLLSLDGENQLTTRTFTKTDEIDTESSPQVLHHSAGSDRDQPTNEATPTAEVTRYKYDAVDNLAERADPLGVLGSGGHRTTWSYNQYDEPTVQTRTAGQDSNNNPVGADSKYLTTSRSYDARGNVSAEVDAKGNGDINDPVAAGANVTDADKVGKRRFGYEYDVFDRLKTSTENPATAGESTGANVADVGLATRYEYDEEDHLKKQTTPAGRATTYDYDVAGRLITKTEPFGYDKNTQQSTNVTAKTTYKRRADGEVYETVAPRGNDGGGVNGFATKLAYYPTGELKKRALPRADGQYGSAWEVSYLLDDAGNPRQVTDARGKTVTNTFLDTGALASTTRPWWWIYDEAQQGVRERTDGDPAPKSSSDGSLPSEPGNGDFGKVKPEQLPDVMPARGATTLTYDDELRLKTVASQPDTGSTKITQSFDYDAVGRMTQRSIPLQGSTTIALRWQYDPVGNVRAQLDGRDAATVYNYDDFDRLRSQSTPKNCTTITSTQTTGDPNCARPQTSQTYDLNSNVLKQVLPASTDPSSKDPVVPNPDPDNIAGRKPTGTTETKTYDQVDRPTATIDAANAKTEQTYDRDGLLTKTLRPQAFLPGRTATQDRYATLYDRDGAGRVTKQTETATDTTSTGTTSTQNLVTSTTYDRNGNPTRIESPGAAKAPDSSGAPNVKPRVQVRGYDGRDLPTFTTIGDKDDNASDARTTFTEYDGNGWLRRTVKPAGITTPTGSDPRPTYPDTTSQDSTGAGDQTRNAETLEYSDDGQIVGRNLPWNVDSTNTQNDDKATSDSARKRYRQQFEYTPRGTLSRITGIYDAIAGGPTHETVVTYNDAGWPSKTTSNDLQGTANTVEMTFDYDKQGNQTSWVAAAGARTVSNRYFPSGQLQSRCGRRTSGNSPEEQIYSFRYDRSGALTRTIDWAHNRVQSSGPRCTEAENDAEPGTNTTTGPRVTNVARDRAGRPVNVNETWDGGKDTAYSYILQTPNLVDSVKTDGRVSTDGTTYTGGTRTRYAYDELDRNTKASVWTDAADSGTADRVSDMRWWPSGDQQEIAKPKVAGSGDPRTKEQRYFDTAGLARQRDVTSADNSEQRTTNYEYDTNGNRTRDERGGRTVNDVKVPGYTYNARDQLTKWTRARNGTAPAETEADPARTTVYTLDGAGRQTHTAQTITQARAGGSNVTTQIETENRFSGDRLTRTERSIKVTQPTTGRPDDQYQTDCYAYGAMGSQTLSIRSTSTTTPACPSSIQAQTGWRTETQNTYDTFERLVASRQRSQTGGTDTLPDNEAYCYDGFDRRDRRITNLDSSQNPGENDDNLTAFQKARAACTQTTTGTGVGVYDYSYLGLTEQLTRENRPNGGLQTYEYSATGQRLGRLKRPSSGATQWRAYETDAQGSVIGLESPTTGKVTTESRYDTDPYGATVGPEGGTTTDAQDRDANPFRFQGFYKDQDTGNYDMQARTYRPAIGQFLQQDRFADPGADLTLASDPLTSSRYAFTAGNPTTRAEYDGHDPHAADTHLDKCRGSVAGNCARGVAPTTGPSGNLPGSSKPVSGRNGPIAGSGRPYWNTGRGKIAVGSNVATSSTDPSSLKRAQVPAAEIVAPVTAATGSPAAAAVEINAAGSAADPKLPRVEKYSVHTLLDAVGVLDPTGIADGVNAALYLAQGDVANAAISGAGVIPYIGDGAKGGRGTVKSLSKACSFAGGTPVLMADGGLKAISDVRVGDKVIATDPKTGKQSARTVTHLWVHQDDLGSLVLGDETLTTTEDHPFWNATAHAWQRADALDRGDRVRTADNRVVRVGAFSLAGRNRGTAYNLTVQGVHTFHVGAASVLVHNDCGPLVTREIDRAGNKIVKPLPAPKWQTDELADHLGYKATRLRSGGLPIYKRGRRYISQDRDSHNGGFWKMGRSPESLGSRESRSGTYDFLLNEIGD